MSQWFVDNFFSCFNVIILNCFKFLGKLFHNMFGIGNLYSCITLDLFNVLKLHVQTSIVARTAELNIRADRRQHSSRERQNIPWYATKQTL